MLRKNVMKKSLAIILSLVMILSMLPTAAFAETDSDNDTSVIACGKSEDCPAATHEVGCPKYVAPVVSCTKTEACAAATHEGGCPKYVTPVVKCTKADDCAATTHEEGCPKYVTPVVSCTKEDSCAAETHEEGCPKYVATVVTCTKALECPAATHDSSCLKAVQEQINALPGEDDLTQDNVQHVKEQIASIDAAKEVLTEEQWNSLDHKAYDNIKILLSDLESVQTLIDPVAEVSGTKYNTLHEALENAPSGSKITLLDNIDWNAETTDGGTEVFNISNCILDLNSKTISANNFSLIFQGENVSIINGAFDSKGGSYGLFIGDEETTNNFIVNNVTISGGINIYNASNVILKNVNVTGIGYYAIWCDSDGKAILESGIIQSKGNAVLGLYSDNTELLIRGGVFNENGKPLVLASSGSNQYGTPVITGGTFASDVSAYVPDGYDVVFADGRYSVERATEQQDMHVAEVDGQYYKSLKNAVEAAGRKTVKLLKNITLTEDLAIGQAEAITFDLNGCAIDGGEYQIYTKNEGTITFTGNGTIKNTNAGASADYAPLRIFSGSNVVLDGVTVEGKYCAVKNSGNLTVKRAVLTGTTFGLGCFGSGTTNVGQPGGSNGDITVTAKEQALCSAAGTGLSGLTLNVYNGTFTTSGSVWDDCPLYWAGHGTANIYGGSFSNAASGTGAAALLQKNGTVNVYGGSFNAKDGIKIVAQSDSTEITARITGGSFTGTRSGIYIDASNATYMGQLSAYSVTIAEGTNSSPAFTGGSEGAIYAKDTGIGGWEKVMAVSGGSFNTPVDQKHCAQDYAPADKENGLYGVKLITYSVTLTYDANDGTNAPEPETKEVRNNGTGTFTISNILPVRDGYLFQGWKAETGDTIYKAGDTIEVSAVTEDTEIILTAQWITYRGYCGDPAVNDGKDVTWALTENADAPGTYSLTISGIGAMASWTDEQRNNRPWNDLSAAITKVDVISGVTTIGQNAFYKLSSLASASLPESIVTIERNAFRQCTTIKTFTIPNSVKTMGYNVLAECVSLEQLEIGTGLQKLGEGCLLDCGQGDKTPNSVLNSVIIPENIEEITGGCFRNCVNAVLTIEGETVTATGNPCGISGVRAIDATRCKSFTINGGNVGSALIYVTDADAITIPQGTNLKNAVTNGGTFPAETTFTDGTLATPKKAACIFGGWYDNADCTGTAITAPVSGKTYYAKWTECTHETTDKIYTAEGTVLTQICSCGVETGTATLTAPENLIFSQTAKEAAVATSNGWKGVTPTISYYNGETQLDSAPVNAGSYTAVISGGSASARLDYTVAKANQTLAFEKSSVTLYQSELPFTNVLTHSKGDGAVTYSSGDENVATVNSSGVVTLVAPGSVIIFATAAETVNYNQARVGYILTVKANPASPDGALTGEKILVSAAVTPAQESAMNTAIAGTYASQFSGKTLWMVDVQLIDTASGSQIHNEKVSFVLAYPSGITSANYKDYSFVILHLNEDGGAELLPSTPTEKGLKISSTLSPFTVGYSLNPETAFTLHFDANGGKNTPVDQTVTTRSGSGSLVISSSKPTRTGYSFKGWSTTEKGRVEYKPGDSIILTGNTDLYAVWANSSDSPGTGDTLNMKLWIAVMAVSGVALAAAVILICKKKSK